MAAANATDRGGEALFGSAAVECTKVLEDCDFSTLDGLYVYFPYSNGQLDDNVVRVDFLTVKTLSQSWESSQHS